jgi:hypothetical protein
MGDEMKRQGMEQKAEGLIFKLLPSGKVLLIPQGSGIHYTLHPGHESDVIDVHKTTERVVSGDSGRYETLLAIPKQELVSGLSQIGEAPFVEFLRLFRPIRLGWIARNHLGVLAFPTDAQLYGVSEIEISSDSLESEKLLKGWFQVPDFIDDVFDMPNMAFLLFKSRHRATLPYGIMFKFPDSKGRLKWIRLRDLRRWSRRMEGVYLQAFKPFIVSQNF